MAFNLYELVKPTIHKMNTIRLSPDDLLWLQVFDGYFSHPDTAIKYMFIEDYFGGSNNSTDMYIKLRDGRKNYATIDNVIPNFNALIKSVSENGYDENSVIGVDKHFYLRDGSHRNALSLYLSLPEIRVHYLDTEIPRTYNAEWFTENGFSAQEQRIIQNKCDELLDKANREINIVLLGSNSKLCDEVAEALSSFGKVRGCETYRPDSKLCASLCEKLIRANNIFDDDGKIKITVKNTALSVLKLKLNKPSYIFADNNASLFMSSVVKYKIPVFAQHDEILKALSDKTFVNEKLVLIPKNFYQNHKFDSILKELL